MHWCGSATPTVARAQDAVGSDADDPAVINSDLDTAAIERALPLDLDRLPGTRNRPRRQPPPLLTEGDVEVGLAARLERMQDKLAARNLRKADRRRTLAEDEVGPPPFDQDPPRQPPPPPAPDSLEQ
jgi:hypothetical protein